MFKLDLKPVTDRAVYFVALREHLRTVDYIIAGLRDRGVHAQQVPYDVVFASKHLPHGTWILTDFERLDASELMATANVRRALLAAGCRVLNDPASWRPRADFLRVLYQSGVNTYQCWRPAAGEWPDRFPVFLRRSSSHTGDESALLEDEAAAQQALNDALERGLILADLVFVEFAGAPVPGRDHYRKYAAYCVGGQVIRAVTVNDTNWMVKHGVAGLASDEEYAAELKEMHDYPHGGFIWSVCKRAGLDFGRVDFGERNGRLEVWEVNSNPRIYGIHPHPNTHREETVRLCFEQLLDAFWRLARAPGPPVSIEECFRQHTIDNDFAPQLTVLRRT